MKKASFWLLAVSLLFSCSTSESSLSSSLEPSSPAVTSSSEILSSDSEEPISSEPSSEPSSEVFSVSSEEPSSSKSSFVPEDGVFDFYCVNDFHGSIVEQTPRYYEGGIAKVFGQLKAYKDADPEHVFIFSAGDMFQGSLESNDNLGSLVVESMNYVGFDAMTVGNHEFDYGLEPLLNNVEALDCPVLAGNIMNYGTTTPWTDQIDISTVIERGGNRVGIVGMIGSGQTTSISSNIVQDLDFVLPDKLALAEAKRLREEEDCNLVIYVIHNDMSSCIDYAADKEYFDGVFCGHTHSKNLRMRNKVPFVQCYCNGQGISHFQITVTNGSSTCTKYETISSQESWPEDEGLVAIRDKYILDPDFSAKANAFAGNIVGTLAAKEGVSNFACKAIFEKYKDLYPDLVLAMVNGQRSPLSGDTYYRDIYKAMPFTNKIQIASVSGRDILRQGSMNNTYTGDLDRFGTLDPDTFYQIACIDYTLLHQDTSKRYDAFTSLNPGGNGEVLASYSDCPHDICFEYLKNDLQGTLDADDYLNSAPGFAAYA